MTGDDNLYDEDRPAKPPKPQPPKPPAPPPPPMVEEALALIERSPPPTEEMNELPVWLRAPVLSAGRRIAPANTPPPPDPCSDAQSYMAKRFLNFSPTGLISEKRATGALREVIRHCFGNYAQWRKLHQSPE
jgi:hypothetical protein